MIVMKFGGSSLANGAQVDKVFRIVQDRRDQNPVVVCSAHKGVTDALIRAAHEAARGEPDPSPILDKQRSVLRELGADEWMLDAYFREIDDLLRGISLVREVSPRVLDHMQSFGERMSVRAVAYYFTRQGMPAEAYDAFDLGFVTNDQFNVARPLDGFAERVQAAFDTRVAEGVVPVITGFVGKTAAGEITTVGRNGSDYTAACYAAALKADECQIWTDTNGVMTCDPNLIPAARNIPAMSFAEAAELAYYGGRVLHPSTLVPAVQANIPVRVLNTNQPDHPGTVITEAGDVDPDRHDVTSIAYKKDQTVITIESAKMLGQPGFLAKVFEVVGRHKVDIDMISTSEVSVSMTTAPGDFDALTAELEPYGRVTVATGKSLVCMVGRDLKRQHGFAGRAFSALGEEKIPVEMISHGANSINVSVLVDDADIDRAVPALHRALFEG